MNACPVCNTELGGQVRSGIFGPDFVWNLVAIALPFPVFGAIVYGIRYVFSREGRESYEDGPTPDPATAGSLADEEEHA